jgi:hypothetical protein
MPSAFPSRTAKLSRAVERAFGEEFTFIARKQDAADVNLPLVADGTRPDFTCKGKWESPAKSENPMSRGATSDDEAIKINSPYASVRVASDLLIWMPTNGCIAVRLLDNTRWRVMKALPADHDVVIIRLTDKRQ